MQAGYDFDVSHLSNTENHSAALACLHGGYCVASICLVSTFSNTVGYLAPQKRMTSVCVCVCGQTHTHTNVVLPEQSLSVNDMTQMKSQGLWAPLKDKATITADKRVLKVKENQALIYQHW